MSGRRVYGAMGLAMRAGKCLAGDAACEKAIKAGRAKLVMLDTAASDNTRARYQGICERAGVRLILIGNMGAAIGKYDRMVAVVTDADFAEMIYGAFDSVNDV